MHHLCLRHKSVALGLLELNLLIDVAHSDRCRLVQLLDGLVARLKLALNAADRKFEQLVLPLRLNDLRLQEVLVLLEGLRTRHPVLDLLVELLLLRLHLYALLVETIHLLVQLVDGLVLESVVAVFGVQLLNERLQLLLLRLHVDGVALQVVVFLLLELPVELDVELGDDLVELAALRFDLRVVE